MEINKQIKTMITELTDNNIPCTKCVITKTYQDSTLCDIKTAHGTYKMIESNQEASTGDTGVLIFLEGSMSKPYVLLGNSGGGGVVMVGSFNINEEGHLIATIPNGASNPYYINESGHLIYNTGGG